LSTARRYPLAINPDLINKNETNDVSLFVDGWQNVELTLEELKAQINAGVAICAQLSGRRRTSNYLMNGICCVDVDSDMSLNAAMAHEIVREHAGFIHTTFSHTAANHRFRIVFPLCRPIKDAADMKALARSLAARLLGDLSATDPARIFFGNTNAEFCHIGNELSCEFIDELIAQGAHPPQADSVSAAGHLATSRSALKLKPDQELRLADGGSTRLGDAPKGVQVFCPFHNDQHASAFILSSRKGSTGIHCSACQTTFWSENVEGYDFNSFDKAVRATQVFGGTHAEPSRLEGIWDVDAGDFVPGLKGSRITFSEGTPVPRKLERGLMLIKSPKGSGKTEGVKHLIADAESILLIGHRRALIRQSCGRLDLPCYLDTDHRQEGRYFMGERLGVCLDSLLSVYPDTKYDVIVLDESEQLLAHFLSDTIEARKGGGRDRIFSIFEHLISRAKTVIALDADLGWVTFATLSRMIERPRPNKIPKKKAL
jgi:hypothetical protein